MNNTSSSTLDFKTGFLFPLPFRFLAVLLLIAAFALFSSYLLASCLLLLAGIGILTAQGGIEFNKSQNRYREYYAFFFIKSGEHCPYERIEEVYINAGKVSQRIYTAHTNSSAVFSKQVYRGFVKLANGNTLQIGQSKKKQAIENKVQQASRYLNAGVADYSY